MIEDEYFSRFTPESFVVQESRSKFILTAVLGYFFTGISIYGFFFEEKGINLEKDWGLLLFTAFFVFVAISFTYFAFHPRTIVVINKEGIWTPKQQWVPWEKIGYYSHKRHKSRYGSDYIFIILTRPPFDTIRLNLSMTDYNNCGTVRRYIELFKGNHRVVDMGEETDDDAVF